MIKPPPFDRSKKIGIVALAGPMTSEKVLAGEMYLRALGYDVLIAPSCFERNRYLAGNSDADRALDLKMMFADDEIGAILNMRGGYGSNRIIPYLGDFDFTCYPKAFIGYSDITYIHIYLNQCFGLATYHGPMISDLIKNDTLTTSSFIKTALNGCPLTLKGTRFLSKTGGTVCGISIGGNLSMICSTLGTGVEIDTYGKLLFLEETGEEPYSIDRLLMQLVHAGKIRDCAGIILGDFSGADRDEITKTIKDILLPFNKTIATDIPAGHCTPNLTIPLGVYCELDPITNEIRFL